MIPVEQIATINPTTVSFEESLPGAASKMKTHHIHHLPVVDGDRLVGMLSTSDLCGITQDAVCPKRNSKRPNRPFAQGLQVGDVCTNSLHVVSGETSLARAAWMMIRNKIRSLPLVRDGRLIGILTDTDLLRLCISDSYREPDLDRMHKWRATYVADAMSSDVVTIEPSASALHAWMLMCERNIRHLPVVRDDGFLVGILSEHDVLYALRGTKPATEKSEIQGAVQDFVVRDIMTSEIVSIGKYETLAEAAQKMLTHDIAALIVLEYDIKGVITRTDLIKMLLRVTGM